MWDFCSSEPELLRTAWPGGQTPIPFVITYPNTITRCRSFSCVLFEGRFSVPLHALKMDASTPFSTLVLVHGTQQGQNTEGQHSIARVTIKGGGGSQANYRQ